MIPKASCGGITITIFFTAAPPLPAIAIFDALNLDLNLCFSTGGAWWKFVIISLYKLGKTMITLQPLLTNFVMMAFNPVTANLRHSPLENLTTTFLGKFFNLTHVSAFIYVSGQCWRYSLFYHSYLRELSASAKPECTGVQYAHGLAGLWQQPWRTAVRWGLSGLQYLNKQTNKQTEEG